jgi:hypothetical protein
VIGARGAGGVAHVFDRTGRFRVTLEVPGATGLGSAATAVGTKVLLGADVAGAAYSLFTSGSLFQTFLPPAPEPLSAFGGWVASLDLHRRVLVGASGTDFDDLARAGAAYVFDATTAELFLTLRSPRPTARGRFGFRAVALRDDFVVSAPGDDVGGAAGGAAYRFDAIAGILVQVYEPPVSHDGAEFGSALTTLGPSVLVGAAGKSLAGLPHAGQAYLFGASGGFVGSFQSPAPVADGRFGDSAATAGGNLLIGESGALVGSVPRLPGTPRAGAVHVFSVSAPAPGSPTAPTKPVFPTLESDANPRPTFRTIASRLEALTAMVERAGAGPTKAGLLRVLHRTQTAVRRAADTTRPAARRRVLLRRAMSTLRTFGNRVESRAGRRLFPGAAQQSVFRLADPLAADVDLLLATL